MRLEDDHFAISTVSFLLGYSSDDDPISIHTDIQVISIKWPVLQIYGMTNCIYTIVWLSQSYTAPKGNLKSLQCIQREWNATNV